MDPLEAVFVFCFVFGLAMSFLSFALGALHLPGVGHHGDLAPADHGLALPHPTVDAHAGDSLPAHPDHSAAAHHGGPSAVNLNTGTAFVAFFGGIGYVVYASLGLAAGISLLIAVAAGLVGGGLVFLFLAKVLYRGQRLLDPVEFRLEGTLARVTRPISADGIGEIAFSRDGTRRSEGARSATGRPIAVGTEVVIVRYERGIAHVEPWSSYVGVE